MTYSNTTPMDVLFVSNNEIDEMLISGYLDTEARIRMVDTFEEVERALQEFTPSVTICEAELRGTDVRKICSELLEYPCVFISSRDRDSERRKCMLKLRECYLTRPYSPEQLNRAVSVVRSVREESMSLF